MNRPPVVSIVIPARNAASTIDACLSAIRQHIPSNRSEIIVADNGSTDQTVNLVSKHVVRVLHVPGGFVSGVRNAGALSARGSIIAFVDADCTVLPGWYEGLVDALSDPAVGVAGSRHELPQQPTWCQRAWQDAQLKRAGNGSAEVPYVPAGNLAIRRELFRQVGGFDERLETGEDPDLCFRVACRGYRIVSAPSMRSVHLGEPPSLLGVYRRERWHGRGARLVYASGRYAPITFVTILFAALLALGLIGAALIPFGAPATLALAAPVALVVPLGLAVRYRPSGRPWQMVQLWAVYSAYFLGRATALPTVLWRMISRPRPRHRTPEVEA